MVDFNPACLTGLYNEFISSGRLDNLMSTFCALKAITEEYTHNDILVWGAFDNEEIGSASMQGADSIIMEHTLNRLYMALPGGDLEGFYGILKRSFIISADMAHAIHPNYPEKHQNSHAPKVHRGVVLKINAN